MKRAGWLLLLLFLGGLAWAPASRADSVPGLVSRGNQAFAAGKIDEALADYQQAAELDPSRPEVQINLGNALFKKGNPADALKAYTNALTTDDPGLRSRALYNRGTAQIALQDYGSAIQSLRQSLRLNPNDEDAKHNLLYAQQKKQEQDEQKKQDQDKKQQDQNKQDQDKQDQDQQDQDKQDQDKQDQEQQDQDKQDQDQQDQDKQDQQKQDQQKKQGEQQSTPQPQDQQQQQQQEQQSAEEQQGEAGEAQEATPSPDQIDPAVAAAILDALQKEEQQQLQQRLQTEKSDEDEDKDW
ncbi:MAG: tetratricopeptide repeat protein [Myxococcales bacterium]|nr:tetratricopeptide repeat protein [Myxococcales bacterium]